MRYKTKKELKREYDRARYLNNKDSRKNQMLLHEKGYKERRKCLRLRREFGITLADYNAMLKSQGGACFICDGLCVTGKALAVDHCHTSGKVRGLLCSSCNKGLGHFKDNPALLSKAITYLGYVRF